MKTCPKCGYQTDNDNAKFCHKCGGNMPARVANDVPEMKSTPQMDIEQAPAPENLSAAPQPPEIPYVYNASSSKKNSLAWTLAIAIITVLLGIATGLVTWYIVLDKGKNEHNINGTTQADSTATEIIDIDKWEKEREVARKREIERRRAERDAFDEAPRATR